MPTCPNCASPLRTIRQREGLFFLCDHCAGRAVAFPQIRRVAGDRFITHLLRQINANPNHSGRRCPFCRRAMRLFAFHEPPLELDACKPCGMVWFDPQEFETVPEGVLAASDQLIPQGREALARYKVKQLAEQARTEDPLPDETWKIIPALFGFPVESDGNPVSRLPWATWSLAAVILMVSLWAFTNLHDVVDRFGLIPAALWRYGGLTTVTSFFLHAGLMHLIGNLYFLLIFGDNVEDYLGRGRYLLLILLAALAGDFLHVVAQPGSTIPCVGASGGISGVIAFYALKFPRVRLGFLFRYFLYFRWIQMPAWGAFVLWSVLQFGLAFLQLGGFSEVAALAHLGGAAVGGGAWLWQRKVNG